MGIFNTFSPNRWFERPVIDRERARAFRRFAALGLLFSVLVEWVRVIRDPSRGVGLFTTAEIMDFAARSVIDVNLWISIVGVIWFCLYGLRAISPLYAREGSSGIHSLSDCTGKLAP